MKCPCCKVINTLDEANRHRSVTSSLAALRAWKSFVDIDRAGLVLAIYPCPKHGSEGGFSAFIKEANSKKRELADRALAEQERIAVQNFEHLLRESMRWVFLGSAGQMRDK